MRRSKYSHLVPLSVLPSSSSNEPTFSGMDLRASSLLLLPDFLPALVVLVAVVVAVLDVVVVTVAVTVTVCAMGSGDGGGGKSGDDLTVVGARGGGGGFVLLRVPVDVVAADALASDLLA